MTNDTPSVSIIVDEGVKTGMDELSIKGVVGDNMVETASGIDVVSRRAVEGDAMVEIDSVRITIVVLGEIDSVRTTIVVLGEIDVIPEAVVVSN